MNELWEIMPKVGYAVILTGVSVSGINKDDGIVKLAERCHAGEGSFEFKLTQVSNLLPKPFHNKKTMKESE